MMILDLSQSGLLGFGLRLAVVTVWTPCDMLVLGCNGRALRAVQKAWFAMLCHNCFVSCLAKTNILGTLQNMFIISDHGGK